MRSLLTKNQQDILVGMLCENWVSYAPRVNKSMMFLASHGYVFWNPATEKHGRRCWSLSSSGVKLARELRDEQQSTV